MKRIITEKEIKDLVDSLLEEPMSTGTSAVSPLYAPSSDTSGVATYTGVSSNPVTTSTARLTAKDVQGVTTGHSTSTKPAAVGKSTSTSTSKSKSSKTTVQKFTTYVHPYTKPQGYKQ